MPSFCLTFGGSHGGITRWHPSAPDHEGTGIYQFDVTHLARRFWTYHLTIVTAINYALYRAIGYSTKKVYCAILHERLAVQVYTDDISSIILGTVGTGAWYVLRETSFEPTMSNSFWGWNYQQMIFDATMFFRHAGPRLVEIHGFRALVQIITCQNLFFLRICWLNGLFLCLSSCFTISQEPDSLSSSNIVAVMYFITARTSSLI